MQRLCACCFEQELGRVSDMEISFTKYEGAGNDFVLVDDRDLHFPLHDAKWIQRLCHRRFGIGADGVILLQHDPAADFRMRIFNSDGSEAEGCGNGLRCLMRFIADLGFKQRLYRIAVSHRILEADYRKEGIGVEMGEMRGLRSERIDGMDIHFVDSGVPHAVWFVPDVETVALETIGPFLRYHSCFAPRGTNVNFAAVQTDGSVRVRTYERGVEGETLACGTGATAVAFIGTRLFGWKSPVKIRFKGGDLEIHLKDGIWMVGGAQKIFNGSFLYTK
jgi:diaminopimelate epimerase